MKEVWRGPIGSPAAEDPFQGHRVWGWLLPAEFRCATASQAAEGPRKRSSIKCACLVVSGSPGRTAEKNRRIRRVSSAELPPLRGVEA
eukprot:scaffold2489_cov259-Pinguiococcus_pyrenoidosus.AAC.8